MGRYYRLSIVSADLSYVLNSLLEKEVHLQDVSWVDELTAEVKVSHKQIDDVLGFLNQKEIHHKIVGINGKGWLLSNVFTRPVLLIGMVLFILLALWLPGRIFFLDVTGNAQIPDAYILETAENCGVHFGVKAAIVRSEEIKNHLLSQLPELQWVGVTTCGFVATIQVKERSELDCTQQFLHSISLQWYGMLRFQAAPFESDQGKAFSPFRRDPQNYHLDISSHFCHLRPRMEQNLSHWTRLLHMRFP